MGDLISRSALINKIKGIVPGSQDVDFIVRLIGDQPTAFNMDAVVAELEKESYQEWCDSPKIVELNDAIDIVRNAGKDGVV